MLGLQIKMSTEYSKKKTITKAFLIEPLKSFR